MESYLYQVLSFGSTASVGRHPVQEDVVVLVVELVLVVDVVDVVAVVVPEVVAELAGLPESFLLHAHTSKRLMQAMVSVFFIMQIKFMAKIKNPR